MKSKFKKRIFKILELAEAGDLPSKVSDIFIITLIFFNVVAAILETVESLSASYNSFFLIFEVISVSIFTIEYLLRLWACTSNDRFESPIKGRIRFAVTPLAIVDLVAILPFYIPMIIPLDLRFVRAARLLRFFRLFKIGRYSDSLKTLGNVLREKTEELLITALLVLILLIIASSLLYFVENEAQPEAFSSIPAAMWWGVATLTTVGYGDVYPITPVGRTFGAIIAILGIGMFALPAGILASGFSEEIQRRRREEAQRRRRERRVCPHCGKDINEPPEIPSETDSALL